jgi:prolyl-tRNA editing enzyme YbaK/EbsC (Cys-tRNA(Pro) deacylase)
MAKKLSSLQRVEQALTNQNISTQIRKLPQSTRTASEAAAAVGCDVAQIVKSLVFQTKTGQKPLLILTSGSNKVNEDLVGVYLGEEIYFASAQFVRDETGFSIGGVSPFGLSYEIPILIDEDLMDHTIIWAAAGSPNAVFSIHPEELVSATGGQVISIH